MSPLDVSWTSICITLLLLGVDLDPSWAKLGLFGSGLGASWAQAEPILRTQCSTLKLCIFTLFPIFWALMEVRTRPCWLHWACLRPTFSTRCSKICACEAQLVSKRAQVVPCWTHPSQLLVGPSMPASFLSVLFPGCGRFSSRSDSNRSSIIGSTM